MPMIVDSRPASGIEIAAAKANDNGLVGSDSCTRRVFSERLS